MKKTKLRILASGALIALALSGCAAAESNSGESASSEDTLIIGYSAALTGDGAAGDIATVAGLRYGVEEVNAAGGVNGIKLQVEIKDAQSDAALGGTATQELIDAGASIIVGPPFPGMASGVLQVAAENNIPVIAGASTQPEYTLMSSGPVFLAAFGDNVQAAGVAEYLIDQGHKSAFLVSSPDMTYTSNGATFFGDAFTELGGNIEAEGKFSIGQTDFSQLVTSIAGEKDHIDVIYAPMFPPDLPSFVRALRAAGVETPLAGPDGFHIADALAAGQEALEGTVYATHGFDTPGSPLADLVEAAAVTEPDVNEAPALAGLGYSIVQIIVAALEETGSTDPAALSEAIQNLEGLETVTGEITYQGTNGVPRKSVTIGGIENGEFVYIDSFVPTFIPEP
jgi:branched-chain amino acid transport system substrate-binding protein